MAVQGRLYSLQECQRMEFSSSANPIAPFEIETFDHAASNLQAFYSIRASGVPVFSSLTDFELATGHRPLQAPPPAYDKSNNRYIQATPSDIFDPSSVNYPAESSPTQPSVKSISSRPSFSSGESASQPKTEEHARILKSESFLGASMGSESSNNSSLVSSDGDFQPESDDNIADDSLEFDEIPIKDPFEGPEPIPRSRDSLPSDENSFSSAEPPAPKRRKISEDDFPFVQSFDGSDSSRVADGIFVAGICDEEQSIEYEQDEEEGSPQHQTQKSRGSLRKLVVVPFDRTLQTEWNLSHSQPSTRLNESTIVTDPRGGVLCLFLKGALPLEALKRQIASAENLRATHPRVWKQCTTGAHRDKRIITMGTSRSYHSDFYALKVTKNEKVIDFITASHETLIRVDNLLKEHFPAVHSLYASLNRKRELPTVYATLQLNDGPSTMHRDRGDCRHGVCAVWPLGNDSANATKSWQGGDLWLQDINIYVDMNPGDIIFFPGHSITHGNLPVTSGIRMSCAAYLNQDFLSLAPVDTSDIPANPTTLKVTAQREIRRTVQNSTASVSIRVDAPSKATDDLNRDLIFVNAFFNPNGDS